MVCKLKRSLGKVAVILLLFAVVAGALTGAAAATEHGNVTTSDDTDGENSSGLTATSADSDDSTIDTSDTGESFGDGTQVSVGVFPTGASFANDATMEIFAGSFNDTEPRTAVPNENLTITVTRPDGTTWTETVTTDSEGAAQTTYDLSNDNQNGTYEVTVELQNTTTSVTVSPTVGPVVDEAEDGFGTVAVGEEQDVDFLVRNGEFGQAGETVNITVRDPDSNIISTQQVQTDENGFATVNLTPQQTGDYEVTADLQGSSSAATQYVDVSNITFSTDYELGEAVVDEPFAYGGYLEDSNGLLANQTIYVEFRNETTTFENITTTTDSSGFFLVQSSISTTGFHEAEITTADGERVDDYLDVDVEDPYAGDGGDGGGGGADINLEATPRDNDVSPGSNVTYDIEATANGSAIENETVTVFARLDDSGPQLRATTVTTDENGAAVVEVPTPAGVNGTDVNGEVWLTYNNTTESDSLFADINTYNIDFGFDYYDAPVGSQVNLSYEATAVDGGSSGSNIPLQYNALYNSDGYNSYARGELVTNESGVGTGSFYVPRGLEPSRGIEFYSRESAFGTTYVNMFEFPGNATLATDAEDDFGDPVARPGEQVTIDFDTGNGSVASGIAFTSVEHNSTINYASATVGTNITSDSTSTLTIPEYAADDSFVEVQVWAADSDGRFYTDEVDYEINASATGNELPSDSLEPNDNLDNATALGEGGSYTNLSVDSTTDEDYFAVQADAGEVIITDLTFEHTDGDVDVALLNASGENLTRAISVSDNETLRYLAEESGTYYLQVYGYEGAINSYDINVSTGSNTFSDALEPNDDRANATTVGTGESYTNLSIGLSNDEDYFSLQADTGETITADMTFEHADGDLDIALLNESGAELTNSTSITDNESINYTVEEDGTYYAYVYGYYGAVNDDYAIDYGITGGSINVTLAAPETAEVGTNVTLNATANQSVEQYRWDLDGNTSTIEFTSTNSELINGVYNVGNQTITVFADGTDGDTASASTTITVTDTTPPTAAVDSPSTVIVGESVTFDASNTTDNGFVENYTWEVSNETGIVASRTTGYGVNTTEFTFSETGNYSLTLTVTDEGGNTDTVTRNFSVVAAANLETAVTADSPQPYDGNTTATITLSNTGTESVTSPFRVGYTYVGEGQTNGNVYNATENLTVDTTIASNSSIQRTVNITDWVRSNRITGDVEFTAVADVDENVSEARRADNVDSTVFEVTYPDLVTSVSSPTVATGATNTTIRSYVRNNGTGNSSGTNVTVTVENSNGATILSNESAVPGLAPNEQNRTRLDPALDAGNYTVTTTVVDDTFPAGNTTTTTVTVEEYDLTTGTAIVPDELEVGQNATVAFRFESNDDANVDATLTLNGSGLALQDSSGDTVTTTVTSEANQPNTVTYDVQAVNATSMPTTLNFTVEETTGADSANRTAETNVTIVTETVTNSTSLVHESSQASDNFAVYNSDVTETHELDVSVQAGANGRTLQGLEYLVNYPYGCVEQTTSAFLGALNTDQYYRDRPNTTISDDRQEVINGSISDGVTRLNESGIRAQQADGSWNMWGRTGAEGDTFYSVYALYGTASVANDEVYGPQNSDALDGVDFDRAVVWLNDEDQNGDGSFSAYSYIQDEEAMTGFTMVAVDNAARTERVTNETQDNITELQGEGADYLIEEQEADGSWNRGNARSTALAVRGLQVALDNGAANESQYNRSEIQTAIDDGSAWLVDNQNSDGSWDPYHDNSYWNSEGDRSVTTAYALLALNETGMEGSNQTALDGTDYLTTVYETDGSWGYPRATAISIDALDQLTGAQGTGTMTIELSGAGTVTETVSVNESTPQVTVSLTESQLDTLRGSGNGTTDVTVTVSDDSNGDSGTIIVGVESTQEIVATTGSDS